MKLNLLLWLTDGSFSDSQIASMSMAILLNGMSKKKQFG